MYACTPCTWYLQRTERGLEHLDLELWVGVSSWVLGIELGSTGRIASTLKHGAITPGPGMKSYRDQLEFKPSRGVW